MSKFWITMLVFALGSIALSAISELSHGFLQGGLWGVFMAILIQVGKKYDL